MKKRTVLVLLTSLPGGASDLIRWCTGFAYTHASIGLAEDRNTFYSFTFKGFRLEKVSRFACPDRAPLPCQLYELEVSERVYRNVRELLDAAQAHRAHLRYAHLGVLLGLLHIAHRGRAGRFFCSQFVAAVLQKSEAATLKKDSSIYLPKDLKDLPGMREVFCGNARDLLRHNESATMPWQVD